VHDSFEFKWFVDRLEVFDGPNVPAPPADPWVLLPLTVPIKNPAWITDRVFGFLLYLDD
jgi:hypothetical protein